MLWQFGPSWNWWQTCHIVLIDDICKHTIPRGGRGIKAAKVATADGTLRIHAQSLNKGRSTNRSATTRKLNWINNDIEGDRAHNELIHVLRHPSEILPTSPAISGKAGEIWGGSLPFLGNCGDLLART
jgi:hypothetical protein